MAEQESEPANIAPCCGGKVSIFESYRVNRYDKHRCTQKDLHCNNNGCIAAAASNTRQLIDGYANIERVKVVDGAILEPIQGSKML